MSEKRDPVRALELALDHYIIYDRTSNRYVIGHREYHEGLVPKLVEIIEAATEEQSNGRTG